MKHLFLPLIFALIIPSLTSAADADAELEEKLKAVMILFDKSQQGLREEVESLQLQLSYLEEQNEGLQRELEAERRNNLDLKTQLLVQQSRTGDTVTHGDVVASAQVAANTDFSEGNQGGPAGQRAGQRGRGVGGRQGAGALQNQAQLQVPEGDLLNINSATKEELLAVPLVNEFLADNIIGGRPWESVDDLIQLQGFGPMKLRRLQPYLTAAPAEVEEEIVGEAKDQEATESAEEETQ